MDTNRPLGGGAAGKVYEVTQKLRKGDTVTGTKHYAFKVLDNETIIDMARIQEESAIIRQINHENILVTFGVTLLPKTRLDEKHVRDTNDVKLVGMLMELAGK